MSGFRLETILDPLSPDGDTRLSLRDLDEPRMLPLAVDFLDPQVLHRLKHGLSRQQPMAKALGLKGDRVLDVVDMTAGLGIDAFFIAALGCRVRAIERSDQVYALLEDGYRRLQRVAALRLVEPVEKLRGIAERLEFVHADAREWVEALVEHERPDVIYLDPMFPEEGRSESALPKKAMQMFRKLVGDDLDAASALMIAREKARERVVVKRPLHASVLGGIEPTHRFEGKTARYDMYLV